MNYHINDLITKKEFDRCNEILEIIYTQIDEAQAKGEKFIIYTGCMGINTTNIIKRKLEAQDYVTELEFQYGLCRNFLKISWS